MSGLEVFDAAKEAQFEKLKGIIESCTKTMDELYAEKLKLNARKNIEPKESWGEIDAQIADVHDKLAQASEKKRETSKKMTTQFIKPSKMSLSALFNRDRY
jgi:inactivated superfamily I helicase